MKITALASGSSGNCFYLENNGKAVLIDCGISTKRIVERMQILRLKPESVKGIFITHEHSDHTKGADVFARTFNVPIFATKGTIANGFLCSNEDLINSIKPGEVVKIAGMEVEAFVKSHKAEEPVSFTISNGKRISVITDLGITSKRVNEAISDSDFLFLESNHDLKMLENGPYPYFLKNWVKGEDGHLSNRQASLAVLEHSNRKLRNVVLSHLSSTNNTPKVALRTFNTLLKERSDFKAKVDVSLRDSPTKLFKI